jgi:hypothetical protein
MSDLKSRGWIIAKGIMFAIIVVLSSLGIVLHEDRRMRLGLLVVCIWASCRFYYFLFYVLERYVGVEGRYTGIFDLARRLWLARQQKPQMSQVSDVDERMN